MKNKKILFVDKEFRMGGAEYSMLDLVKSTVKTEFESYAIIGGHGVFESELLNVGIKKIYINRFQSWRWWGKSIIERLKLIISIPLQILSLLNLIRVFKEINPDIIHFNTTRHIIAMVAAKILGLNSVVHFRELPKNNSDFFGGLKLLFYFLHMNNFWIANSMTTYNSLRPFKRNKKIKVIYNGIDTKKFKSIPKIYNTNFKIVMLATIVPWKRIELFIEIAERIIRREKRISFLIAGKGDNEYLDSLVQIINKKKLNKNIRFKGFVKNIPEFLSNCHMMLHTSGAETFGRVYVEAMLSNLPVIALRGGASEEIILNNITGYLFSESDLNYVVEKVIHLYSSHNDRQMMGKRGKERAIKKYSIERLKLEIVSYYRNLILV